MGAQGVWGISTYNRGFSMDGFVTPARYWSVPQFSVKEASKSSQRAGCLEDSVCVEQCLAQEA